MKPLKITIRPKKDAKRTVFFRDEELQQALLSSGYDVQVGDWTLGRGVSGFKLEMPAGEKPKATIVLFPDVLDIEITAAGVNILNSENDSD